MGGEDSRICLWVSREAAVGKAYILNELRFEMVPLSMCGPSISPEACFIRDFVFQSAECTAPRLHQHDWYDCHC